MHHKTRARNFFAFSSIAAVILLGVLAGCGGSSDEPDAAPPPSASSPSATAEPSDDIKVIQPGKPGEGAVTGGPVSPATTQPTPADIAFMQMMVPHHAQAVEMSELAGRYATDPRVRSLAARIRAAQGPEILMMSAWLEEHGIPASADGAHQHGGHGGSTQMMGMLTPQQMDELAAARGARFDRLFLEGMIRHHEGAVRMANTVAARGIDVRVAELAGDVSITQNAEIARMRDLLR
jgi:uncharacterized protein (DUF305 family)